jgi:hypothetical protein
VDEHFEKAIAEAQQIAKAKARRRPKKTAE